MEKKLPEFKPLPELGNVANNYMSAFNVGMNIYEALAYLQGYVQITYNSMDDLIDDWNNFEAYVTENINQIANEKTKEILNQWLSDGTLNNLIAQNPMWNQKANKDDLPPKENWLDNADFKSGIINQRGETTYTGKTSSLTYTIDRWWISKSATVTLTANNGYISVNLPTLQLVGQYIEFEPNGEMTIAVKLRNKDLKVFTLDNYTNNIDALVYNFGEIDTDVSLRLLKYSSDDKWQVSIYNESESTKEIDIEFIKLEKGSVFTGMPQWDEPIEYLKCRKYFYTLGGGWNNMFHARTDSNYISIYIPILTPMVKTPSLIAYKSGDTTNRNVSIKGTDGEPLTVPISEFVQSANLAVVSLSAPLGERKQIGYGSAIFPFDCGLDAEAY